ncbi:MAG: protein kinase [Planctomycetota bacterium]
MMSPESDSESGQQAKRGREAHDLDWAAVRELFEACLDQGPEERAARLACAAPALRAEVTELLEQQSHADRVLEPDTVHRSLLRGAASDPVGHGGRIGAFTILGELGRGGASIVYLATQASPRREVALKILVTTALDEDGARRFELEAELLARLQHPSIAQVYAAGVHEEQTAFGRVRWPYFALEYVASARDLSTWSKAAQPDDRRSLEVVLQICDAIQHAHERGVVHRDLKPANVLVDDDDRVKVIDFGIARHVEAGRESRPDPTQAGAFLGTPNYMAPEQLQGDLQKIGTRTDVYALGVVLFELLAGRLPHDVAEQPVAEIARIVCEQPAVLLRRVRRNVDPDLEQIVAACLRREPSERYAQAGALAADLRRYLAKEPISMRRPTFAYQLRMFARRRRGLVLAMAATLTVAAVGGGASILLALRAQRAERQVLEESARRGEAMRRVFTDAMRRVIDLPAKLVGLPGATKLRRDVVMRAVEQLEYVAANVPLDRDMRAALARAYFNLSDVQHSSGQGHFGEREQAVANLACATTYLDQVLADNPDDTEILLQKFDVQFRLLGIWFDVRPDHEAAVAPWRTVQATAARLQQLLPESAPRLLMARSAVARHLGCIAISQRRAEDAERQFETAIELRAAARAAGRIERVEDVFDSGWLQLRLAMARRARGDQDGALATFERAVQLMGTADKAGRNVGGRRYYAVARGLFGYELASRGRGVVGEAHMRWAAQELERQYANDSQNVAIVHSLARAVQMLADHVAIQAKYEADESKARAGYEEARGLCQRALEVLEPVTANRRGRDMVSILVVAECERIAAACDAALAR